MESFILWGLCADADEEDTLSWFATPIGDQGIKAGSREMLETMLRDLGYERAKVAEWQVRHFRTNYLAGGEDVWQHAWELTAKLATPLIDEPNGRAIVRTSARDATWDGALPPPPTECVLFVDFRDADVADRAERILGRAAAAELGMTLRHRGVDTAQLLASFGEVDEAFFTGGAASAKKAAMVFGELGATTSRKP